MSITHHARVGVLSLSSQARWPAATAALQPPLHCGSSSAAETQRPPPLPSRRTAESIFFSAWLRLRARPAPCDVLPKVCCIACSVPTSTYDAVPMDPPISTGCPMACGCGQAVTAAIDVACLALLCQTSPGSRASGSSVKQEEAQPLLAATAAPCTCRAKAHGRAGTRAWPPCGAPAPSSCTVQPEGRPLLWAPACSS